MPKRNRIPFPRITMEQQMKYYLNYNQKQFYFANLLNYSFIGLTSIITQQQKIRHIFILLVIDDLYRQIDLIKIFLQAIGNIYIVYRLISPMKEEKRKSTIMSNHLVKKATQIKNLPKERAVTIQLKENIFPKQSLRKLLDKNIKRIGSKVTMKSFQTVISQASEDQGKNIKSSQSNQNLYKNSFEASDFLNKPKQTHKKLKRIGKKNQITAFKQVICDQQFNGVKNAPLNNEQTIITIRQPNYSSIQEQPIKKNEIQNQNNDCSYQKKDSFTKNDQQNLLSDGETDSLLFQKVISDQGKADLSRDSFSINVNMVDGNFQVNSIFDKSDRCVESPITLKTQSDAGKSNSLILHGGELEKLINQQKQSYVPSSQNQEDSKIQELIQEIQHNYAKNFQDLHKQQKSKPSRGSNYLQVPKGEHRMSDGKYNLYKIEKKKCEECKQRFQKDNLGAVGEKSTLQPRKNSFKSSFSFLTQKSQEELILQTLEQETKLKSKPNKRNSNEKIISNEKKLKEVQRMINNEQTISENQAKRKSKEQMVAQHIKCDSILQQIEEAKEEQYKSESTAKSINYQHYKLIKKPLPPAFPVRQKLLVASEGPKVLLEQTGPKKLVQSIGEHINCITPKNDISLSQVKLNEIKIKEFNNGSLSNSVHHQLPKNANIKLKRQSISKVFGKKKLKKTESILEDVKFTSSVIKNSKPFQTNKCVAEARKILHQSVHI